MGARKLLDELVRPDLRFSGPVKSGKEIEAHFLIERAGPGQIWLESLIPGDSEIGPIPVPTQIARASTVGWDVGGVIARTKKGWRLVEVWNISP